MKRNKIISYWQAINEATIQIMEQDSSVFVYGIGVPDHKKIFGTTNNILEMFGKERCFDTPICEDSLTGFGIGASINGLKPIFINLRSDFLLLAVNQIGNILSSMRYLSNGNLNVSFVIRAIIGRGWGQGCQHSKSCQSIFSHFPGIKVVMPTTPREAKGLLVAAVRDNNPVIILEHRWLYFQEEEVDENIFAIPLEKAVKRKDGNDITVIATSWMNVEALKARKILEKNNITIEIIDPICVSNIDIETIMESVKKTRNCIVADCDWLNCGVSSEISTKIYENCIVDGTSILKNPIERIGFKQVPCPTVRHLEYEFYPSYVDIIKSVEKLLDIKKIDLLGEDLYTNENKFKGPF